MTHLSRRRFLTISAAVLATPAMAQAPSARWQGRAMGTRVSMRLDGASAAEAAPVFAALEAELDRLERIFSLYRTESQISRLNRDGHLDAPAPELLQVLSLCASVHAASGGVFDPTIQPLWQALADGVGPQQQAEARAHIGWHQVHVAADHIRLNPGAALTLNGVAQGAITDQIARLLRGFGTTHCLIDMGEVAALGPRKDGTPWQAGIANPAGQVLRRVHLSDRALATSSPFAMQLPGSSEGHILHPQGATPAQSTVAVSAPTAAAADALSTAACLMPRAQAEALSTRFAGARVELAS